jgi:LEA14-like dessication related protein
MKVIYFAILTLVLLACAPFKEPVFKKFDGFEMGKIDGQNVNFQLKSTVYNPNWYALKIKPSMLEVTVDDKKFGNLYLDKKLKIKAKKETQLVAPLHAELENGAMMRMMGMMLRDSVRVKLQGDVKGGVFFIYKKFPVELNRSVSPKSLNPMRNLNPLNKN